MSASINTPKEFGDSKSEDHQERSIAGTPHNHNSLQTILSSSSVSTTSTFYTRTHTRANSTESIESKLSDTLSLQVYKKEPLQTDTRREDDGHEVQKEYKLPDQQSSVPNKDTSDWNGDHNDLVKGIQGMSIAESVDKKEIDSAASQLTLDKSQPKNSTSKPEPVDKKPTRPTLESLRTSSYFEPLKKDNTPRRWRGHLDRNLSANPGASTCTP